MIMPPKEVSEDEAALTRKISGILLVLANLIPLYGVLFRGWSVYNIVALYWLENVAIGVFNLLKIGTSRSNEPSRQKLFMIPFFTVHYGMFCLVHGIFIQTLLKDRESILGSPFGQFFGMVKQAIDISWYAALAIVGSHFFSYIYHFLIKGESRDIPLNQLMFAPYRRIMILHFAILFGAVAISALGSPVYLLVVLVIAKIIFDFTLHRKSHNLDHKKTAR